MNSFKNLWQKVTNFLAAAMYWFGFGFDVIPIVEGKKIPAVKWGPWLDNLDHQKVQDHWTAHPEHELGCIVGDDMIVLDADSKEAVFALVRLESRFGMMPKMVVNTSRGQHHYFRRAHSTIAKSDAHDSEKYPERIDVKTGRALIILPMSTGKTLRILDVETKGELSEATQDFIDAIFEHNGRTIPTEPVVMKPITHGEADETSLQKLKPLLDKIDPDCGYEDWLHVGMAIFHETNGGEEGQALFDRWSNKGNKYKGSGGSVDPDSWNASTERWEYDIPSCAAGQTVDASSDFSGTSNATQRTTLP
jgi:hypothetical protein